MERVKELEEVYEAAKAESDRAHEICVEAQALFIAAENHLKASKVKEARVFNELTAGIRAERRTEGEE